MSNDQPESVLIIQTAFLGDVVLVTPLIDAVSRLWSNAKVDILVRPPSDNLVETNPAIRTTYVFDKYGDDKGLSGMLRLVENLRPNEYNLVLSPHRSFRSGLIGYLTRCKTRIGFNRGGASFFLTSKVDYQKNLHEVERNLSLLNEFNKAIETTLPHIYTTNSEVDKINRILGDYVQVPLIAIAPGSVWFTKRWPLDYFIEFGKRLISDNFTVVLIGGKEDRAICQRISIALKKDTLNLAGMLSLRESVEALRRCRVLISNDSAPTHFGTAAGCDVLTIFGSTSPAFGFAPYGSKGRSISIDLDCKPCTDHGRQSCPKKHLDCLQKVTPDMVNDELKKLLEETGSG